MYGADTVPLFVDFGPCIVDARQIEWIERLDDGSGMIHIINYEGEVPCGNYQQACNRLVMLTTTLIGMCMKAAQDTEE